MVSFLKNLFLDLAITATIGGIVHFGLIAYGTDEVQVVEATLGYIVDTLGVYHEPDRQQGRYLD